LKIFRSIQSYNRVTA